MVHIDSEKNKPPVAMCTRNNARFALTSQLTSGSPPRTRESRPGKLSPPLPSSVLLLLPEREEDEIALITLLLLLLQDTARWHALLCIMIDCRSIVLIITNTLFVLCQGLRMFLRLLLLPRLRGRVRPGAGWGKLQRCPAGRVRDFRREVPIDCWGLSAAV